MAELSFQCLHETNEDSPSDSPYFLVYAGDRENNQSDVQRVRDPNWDDAVDAGDPMKKATVPAFDSLVKNLDVVLVALIEEDWAPDTNLASKVRNKMNDSNKDLKTISGSNLRVKFINAIESNLANDDLVNVQRFSNNAWKFLSGDEAIYRVKIAH